MGVQIEKRKIDLEIILKIKFNDVVTDRVKFISDPKTSKPSKSAIKVKYST